jgi:hypothetical protein
VEREIAASLPVADMLRFLTYAEGYGQFAMAREQFQALPAEVAAVRFNSCASCSIQCPTECKSRAASSALRSCLPEPVWREGDGGLFVSGGARARENATTG